MDINQAKQILKEIYIVYPNFNRNKNPDFDKVWIRRLMEGEYEESLRKFNEYSRNSSYLPTLADVLHVKQKQRYDGMAEHMKNQVEEAERQVAEENKDPEVRKRKEQLLSDMREKLKRKKANE